MRRIVLFRDATREFEEAAQWYERQERELGQELITCVREKLFRIRENPGQYQRWQTDGPYQRAPVSRFPYAIFYTAEDDAIYVYAIAHLKRKPGYWLGRDRDD